MLFFKTLFVLFITVIFAACSSKPKSKVDWSEVNQVFYKSNHEKKITSCFNQLKKTNPKAKGQLQINYSFYGNAKDIQLQDISNGLENAGFKLCVQTYAEQIDLRPIKEKYEQTGHEFTLEVQRIYAFE